MGSAFACEVCGKDPANGTSTFRQNPRGERGIWRCREHATEPVPADVARITTTLDRNVQ